jgi:endogenous inhibitor of DNA gyrase (YacG/DUF329 family)
MAPGALCPICNRPADPRHRPFCSRRCADVDLAHWLRGTYVIPGAEPDLEEDETRDEPQSPSENDD